MENRSFVRSVFVGIVAKKAYRGQKRGRRGGGIKEKIGAFNSRVGERRIVKRKNPVGN